MSKIIFEKVLEALNKDEEVALVMLTNSIGSVPGAEESMMAVYKDGKTIGTVGGGKIEFDLIKRSLKALETGESFTFKYTLNETGELKMTCGGVSEVFVRIVKPNEKLVIFGAGHVSQKIASIASSLSFDVYIVDDREEFKNVDTFKDVKKFLCCTPSEALSEINLNNRSYVILVTRGHVTDYEALKEVINRDVAYIGMMGSKKKVKEIKEKLNNEDIDKEKIKKLYAPIGLDICNGTPEEIAISIISEILVIKNKGTLKHLSEREE